MIQKELFASVETNNSKTIIVGLDEAGRGPLAGPVYAAAVILPDSFPFEFLNDSKKLSAKKRKEAEIIIKKEAVAYAIGFATASEIDELNILWASMLAMKRAYIKVSEIYSGQINLALIDGNRVPDIPIKSEAIVKGDAKIHEIMAASILAKNARDEIMLLCDKKWPIYGFKKHMGYPTKIHRQMLEKYGACPIHRKSFSFKKVESKQIELF
ncbi:MAG: ribonuclease HII [Spirochaetaceae bacterium]|nr:ribonuclease HII [Spirochaetaceae bacterium]